MCAQNKQKVEQLQYEMWEYNNNPLQTTEMIDKYN